MSGLTRQSSFLPTIKCSSCGNQIEISLMGEHICGQGSVAQPASSAMLSAPAPAPASMPGSLDAFMPFNKSVHEKIGRVPPPPSVDTKVANRSYYRAGQLTPHSLSSGSRSVSPQTPIGRPGTARPDDYAPKIADDFDAAAVQQTRGSSGYGGMDEPNAPPGETMYPSSPKVAGSNLLQRMNTIAPGPFEMKRRAEARAARGGSVGGPDGDASDVPSAPSYPSERRPSTAGSIRSNGAPPPRPPRKDGYGGFGPPLKSPDELEPPPLQGQLNRAGTFPRPSEPTEPPARAPSAPGPRPERFRSVSSFGDDAPPMPTDRLRRPSAAMGPDTSRPPPPRTSVVRPRTAGRDGSVPAINLAEEFGIGNPYHTSSESMSSSASSVSRPTASSNSSPPRSVASRKSSRKPSDTSTFDALMSDIQTSMDELQPVSLDRQFSNSSRNRHDPAVQAPQSMDRNRPRSPLSPYWNSADPAIQAPGRDPNSLQPNASPRLATSDRQRSRGACRGCGENIVGKSIKCADGRLSGRYHKPCFVCTKCRSPFPSATFYVHDDRPYCERHYHELNGSLCGSCDHGIEGQYLADERDKKYHPGCFRCGDCGMVLQDGYFDVNGKAYCEKDAWRRVQQPWLSGGRQLPGPGGRGGPLGGPGMGPGGLPGRPGGPPMGSRLAAPMPRMEKRMTRLGMLG